METRSMRMAWIGVLLLALPGCAMAAAKARNPCLTQSGRALSVRPLRAVGTEPFWGARITGRCVTYSELDDQHGNRIWTRYRNGVWTGTYRRKPFILRVRRESCSDGMSDRVYPIAVDLRVAGERRTGCAFNP